MWHWCLRPQFYQLCATLRFYPSPMLSLQFQAWESQTRAAFVPQRHPLLLKLDLGKSMKPDVLMMSWQNQVWGSMWTTLFHKDTSRKNGPDSTFLIMFGHLLAWSYKSRWLGLLCIIKVSELSTWSVLKTNKHKVNQVKNIKLIKCILIKSTNK